MIALINVPTFQVFGHSSKPFVNLLHTSLMPENSLVAGFKLPEADCARSTSCLPLAFLMIVSALSFGLHQVARVSFAVFLHWGKLDLIETDISPSSPLDKTHIGRVPFPRQLELAMSLNLLQDGAIQ